jgi:hypothetical protein
MKHFKREKILKECNDLITIKDIKRYFKRNFGQTGGLGVSGNVGTLTGDILNIPTRMLNLFDSIEDLFDYVANDVDLNAGVQYTSGAFSGLN